MWAAVVLFNLARSGRAATQRTPLPVVLRSAHLILWQLNPLQPRAPSVHKRKQQAYMHVVAKQVPHKSLNLFIHTLSEVASVLLKHAHNTSQGVLHRLTLRVVTAPSSCSPPVAL